MGNNFFKFKQFTINQDKTAMKVGTDGVLLGAYANAKSFNKILDVGTGTGLIALMCAQQNNKSNITGIEIDNDAYSQAKENVSNSKFNNIKIILSSLQDFEKNTKEKFDLIICNPPYFPENSYKSKNKQRALARHGNTLSYNELIKHSIMLMHTKSMLKIIIPNTEYQTVYNELCKNNIYINSLIKVRTTPYKQAKRLIIFASKNKQKLNTETIIIEQNGRHNYSNRYIELTKDYYLFL